MSGAYVAKPAVASTPDPPIEPRPPDWDDFDEGSWPFDGGESGLPGSGPHPPGYTPDYSLVMTATAEITPTGTASVTGSLRDHSTFATGEPSAIAWTAAIDGESVDLKFTGESFASSISSSTSFLTYWGAAPSIEFDLTDDNDGDVVVLTGTTTVGGETITQTVEIEIAVISEIVITFKYELIGVLGAGYYYGRSRIRVIDTPLSEWCGSVFWYVPDYAPDYWDVEKELPEDEVEIETSLESPGTRGGTATVTVLSIRDGETYEIKSYVNFSDCVAKVTATITIGEDEYEFTDTVSGVATTLIIEIDGTTLEVTQTGP